MKNRRLLLDYFKSLLMAIQIVKEEILKLGILFMKILLSGQYPFRILKIPEDVLLISKWNITNKE